MQSVMGVVEFADSLTQFYIETRHLGAKHLGADIWAQRHLGARHLGAKCVLAHFQQSFSISSKKNFYKNFIFSTVLVF